MPEDYEKLISDMSDLIVKAHKEGKIKFGMTYLLTPDGCVVIDEHRVAGNHQPTPVPHFNGEIWRNCP